MAGEEDSRGVDSIRREKNQNIWKLAKNSKSNRIDGTGASTMDVADG